MGRVTSHVARGTDNPPALIKATITVGVRRGCSLEDIEQMLGQVYAESVETFLRRPVGSPWRQPGRLERFNRAKSLLLAQWPGTPPVDP